MSDKLSALQLQLLACVKDGYTVYPFAGPNRVVATRGLRDTEQFRKNTFDSLVERGLIEGDLITWSLTQAGRQALEATPPAERGEDG